jgi:DNA-binding winged helix-turn-helix (wHTH) protein
MPIEVDAREGAKSAFRLGDWLVEPSLNRISKDEISVQLELKVMDVLVCLVERAGEMVTRQEIIDRVWATGFIADNTLSHAIAEMRTALGDDAREPHYIETIPRRGYRMIAPVAPIDADRVQPSGSVFWLTGAGVELVLRQGENLIGRAPDAYVRIKSPKISRRHARITVDGESAVVEDLGSKNGTFVGDVRVDRPTPLGHADQIRLGQLAALLRIVIVDHEGTITELSEDFAKESSADE